MAQTYKPYPKETCPLLYTLNQIGQKWKIPILWHLADEKRPVRYNEFKKLMPSITGTMLTKSLRELEESGLIQRKAYDFFPLKVEYTLSQKGKSLVPILYELHNWGVHNSQEDF